MIALVMTCSIVLAILLLSEPLGFLTVATLDHPVWGTGLLGVLLLFVGWLNRSRRQPPSATK